MSDVQNTQSTPQATTPATATPDVSSPVINPTAPATPAVSPALTAMRRLYEDRNRVVVLSGDDMTVFADFLGDFDETNPATDWTKGAPWANPTVAMVQVEETGANRLIAIAPLADALADNTVREWAYKQYLRHVLKVASATDASAEKFLTPAGAFRPKYDIEAFKTEAKVLVPFLRSKGLKGITTPLLRNAFANAAFAEAQFSRIPKDTWGKLLTKCMERAAARGEDVSLFEHWIATRDAMTDSGAAIELDFEELGKELDEALADDGESEQAAVPAVTAS